MLWSMGKREQTPNDGTYKDLYSHPEMVESLIQDFVHEDWVQNLDFSTLEKTNASYVTEDLRERHDDIIWRLKWKDQWCYVYLLIEFQSEVDPWMALRVMIYTGLLYQDLIKSGVVTTGDYLPPVFPIVLYNGENRWNAPLDVADLIAPSPKSIAKYFPKHRICLLDENGMSRAELEQADGLSAILFRLETSRDIEDIKQILQYLAGRLQGERNRSIRRAFTIFVNKVLFRRIAYEPRELPEVADLQEARAMLSERAEKWRQEWVQDGVVMGRVDTLRRQLSKRFGSEAAAEYHDTMLQASSEQLDVWLDRILDAQTIEDVFSE